MEDFYDPPYVLSWHRSEQGGVGENKKLPGRAAYN